MSVIKPLFYSVEFLTNSSKTMPMLKTVKVLPVKGVFAKKKGKLEKTYNTLGGAIACIGLLDVNDKNVKKIFR